MATASDVPGIRCEVHLEKARVAYGGTGPVYTWVQVSALRPANNGLPATTAPVDVGILLHGVDRLSTLERDHMIDCVRYVLLHMQPTQHVVLHTDRKDEPMTVVKAGDTKRALEVLKKMGADEPHQAGTSFDVKLQNMDAEFVALADRDPAVYRVASLIIMAAGPVKIDTLQLKDRLKSLRNRNCEVHTLVLKAGDDSCAVLSQMSLKTYGTYRVMDSAFGAHTYMRPLLDRIFNVAFYRVSVHFSCDAGTRLVGLTSPTNEVASVDDSKRYVVEIPALTYDAPVAFLLKLSLRALPAPMRDNITQQFGTITIDATANVQSGLGPTVHLRGSMGHVKRGTVTDTHAREGSLLYHKWYFQACDYLQQLAATKTHEQFDAILVSGNFPDLARSLSDMGAGDFLQRLRPRYPYMESLEKRHAAVYEALSYYMQHSGEDVYTVTPTNAHAGKQKAFAYVNMETERDDANEEDDDA